MPTCMSLPLCGVLACCACAFAVGFGVEATAASHKGESVLPSSTASLGQHCTRGVHATHFAANVQEVGADSVAAAGRGRQARTGSVKLADHVAREDVGGTAIASSGGRCLGMPVVTV